MKKFLIFYFFSLVLFLSIFCSGVFDSQDGFQYLAVARNIYYTGKPTAPVYEYNQRKNIHMATFIGKDGNSYSSTGLGYSLALVPAVAITDVFYKIYQVTPPTHFPLENDWLILLVASFTNIFFAATLALTLFLYLIEIGLSKKNSWIISIVAIFATNLFVYAKNSFAHMMFATFLTLTFFLIKKYYKGKEWRYLMFAGMTYGIVTITYNSSFLLTVPPLIIYFYLLKKTKISLSSLTSLFKDFIFFSVGLIPFLIIYIWFETLRSAGYASSGADPVFYASYAQSIFSHFYFTVFFEGIFGQLFSSGRSIFIYSPILLIIIFFWHKIKPALVPELIIFILMSIIYISFFAIQVTYAVKELGLVGLWHGESSWGPRYLTPLIPFGILIVGAIYQNLTKFQKYLVFYPLVLIGLYIQLLGVIMPYQIKLYNLDHSFYINGTEFTSYAYSNLIPRYSPILTMSKNLAKLVLFVPKTLDHGEYNTKLYDGIDFTFDVGQERWRVIEDKGNISFDNWQKDPVKKMSFGLINHPIAESSSSAKLQFTLNNNPLLDKPLVLGIKERNIVDIPIESRFVKDRDNQLLIDVLYDPPLKDKTQITAIISYSINNHVVNLESIDTPYVSQLGPLMTGVIYQNYGGLNKNPWKTWDIHTRIYERTPDFWWFKALYYWDYPKLAIFSFFTFIAMSAVFFGVKTFKSFRSLK